MGRWGQGGDEDSAVSCMGWEDDEDEDEANAWVGEWCSVLGGL